MLSKASKLDKGCLLCCLVVLGLSAVLAIYIWGLIHPQPVRLSTLRAVSSASGLTFPPTATVVDGGAVNETATVYPTVWCFAVVIMPKRDVATFLAGQPALVQIRMRNPPDAQAAKRDIMAVQRALGFRSSEWRAVSARHFKAAYIYGIGGQVFIDLDDPSVARVYISEGW